MKQDKSWRTQDLPAKSVCFQAFHATCSLRLLVTPPPSARVPQRLIRGPILHPVNFTFSFGNRFRVSDSGSNVAL